MSEESVAAGDIELSIVSTLYRSERFVEEFVQQCVASVRAIGVKRFEIVLVDDGSPDDSLRVARECQERVKELILVSLTRNFGHHYAAHAGLSVARGAMVFLIDSDLEIQPSVLERFHEEYQKGQLDVVYGYQEQRKGSAFERLSGEVFWRVFNAASDTRVPINVVTERLMSRAYVGWLLELGDRNLFMAGMMYWVGARQLGIPVPKKMRSGLSTYNLLRKVDLMVEAITSFSAKPLRWIFYLGTFSAFLSLAFLAGLLLLKIIDPGRFAMGWPSVIGSLALATGITNASLGLLGIYLSRVYSQVQGRPRYFIRDIYRGNQTS